MRILKLNACIYGNVGDDLMVEVLLKRYPKYKFFYSHPYYTSSDKFLKYPNFINLSRVYKRWGKINHLVNLVTFYKYEDCVFRWAIKGLEKKCFAAVYIGGSLYIEKEQESIAARMLREREKLKNGPLFIIGANFGPFRNPEFEVKFHEYFSECAGVCFRESNSYKQFSDIPHVSYAPDVVFNLPVFSSEGSSNHVAISVIDFHNRPELSDCAEDYDRFIRNVCKKSVSQGKSPILIAFCEYEGDNDAVNSIYKALDDDTKGKTEILYYRNLDQIVDVFRNADFVLATRFHAMILALRFNKPFFCVSYNQKIKNVLDDLGSSQYCLPEQLFGVDVNHIFDYHDGLHHLEGYIHKANLQFRQLDDFLAYKK